MTTDDRDLVLTRQIDAPRAKLWRCWTEPELLKQWFTPPPVIVTEARLDVRTGGTNMVVMRLPDGTEMPNAGVYLEIVPNQRLVFTNAYTKAWEPSDKPFMTVILTFEEAAGSKTNYTARARHWSIEDRKTHEKMGFHTGWGIATDQLAALANKL